MLEVLLEALLALVVRDGRATIDYIEYDIAREGGVVATRFGCVASQLWAQKKKEKGARRLHLDMIE